MTHDEIEAIAALDALGAATADEERAMSAHLAGCDSCRRARDEYADAATALAMSLDPVDPPADLRERIVGGPKPVLQYPSFKVQPWWLATAATLFLALWGWREVGIRVAHEHIIAQQAEIRGLTAERDRLSAQNEKLASLVSPDTRTIALAGQKMSPAASARVFLDPTRRRAIVFFHNLPTNPTDKSYQIWIIRGDQPNPQSAGVFDVTPSGNAILSLDSLPVLTEIKALAVTMERRGGTDQPSEKKFYVMGGMS